MPKKEPKNLVRDYCTRYIVYFLGVDGWTITRIRTSGGFEKILSALFYIELLFIGAILTKFDLLWHSDQSEGR
jgi:hypothetical protein